MHRLHHAHTDTELDPHSPNNSDSIFQMYTDTKTAYINILKKRTPLHHNLYLNVPVWESFDKLATSKYSRLFWLLFYLVVYWLFAPNIFFWIFLPVQLMLLPIQGLIVNWFAHAPRFGTNYRNFEVNNLSANIFGIDILFLGEGYHNNHHAHPGSVNLRVKWYEIDFGYYIICFFDFVGILKLKRAR